MISLNGLCSVAKVFLQFPGRDVPSDPLDKVFGAPAMDSVVEDIFDFVFFFVFDDNWGGS